MRWLRLLVALLVTIEISVIGWIAAHYNQANRVPLWLAYGLVGGAAVGLAGLAGRVYKNLDRLEDL